MIPRGITIGVLAGWQVYQTATPLSFLGPLLDGICVAAQDRVCNVFLACGMSTAPDYSGITHPAWPIPSDDSDFVPVGPWNTDGLIVINPLLTDERARYVQGLQEAGHPIVFIGQAQGGPAVDIDNEEGIRQAVAHLTAHGHERIAFVAGHTEDSHGDSGARLKAYWDAVQELSLVADPALVAHGFHTTPGGEQAMQALLQAGVPFTAVVASNDESAIGAAAALRKAGLRIPEDVALVGFDDRPEAMAQEPPLTTIHAPTFERGYKALELLLERINDPEIVPNVVKVPTHLIVRESCGCQPDEDSLHLSSALSESIPTGDLTQLSTAIAGMMAERVFVEVRRMSSKMVRALCARLSDAIISSLEEGTEKPFRHQLEQVLRQVEAAGEDIQSWREAILAWKELREAAPHLFDDERFAMTTHQIEQTLASARSLIDERARRQYWRNIVEQNTTAEQLGLLTAKLLSALNESQIFTSLEEHLQELGMRYAGVAFFETQDKRQTPRCFLRSLPQKENVPLHFPTHEFPPPGFPPQAEQPFQIALLPLKIQDEQVGFVAFDAVDLALYSTIVRQLTAAFQSVQLYREADEARRLAEEANQLKSRFLSMVSHELCTPLNLITGLAEMLLQRIGDSPPTHEAYRDDVERIYSSAQHLDGLIRDVLDLSRDEMGQLKLTREPLDLVGVLRAAASVGEKLAEDKGLHWHAEIPEELPYVQGDRTRLQQVVLNLISNAVKFTSEGEVSLKAQVDHGRVKVAVRDTGMGVPVGEQAAIFDEFRQSERSIARGYGGLGLGLTICQRLVEMHGGQIWVESAGEEGAGSTFRFTLPVMKEPPIGRTHDRARRAEQGAAVLLAEEREQGGQLREHLAKLGSPIEVVWLSEEEAWLQRVLDTRPGAIILDTQIAAERGWKIVQKLKRHPETQDTQILFYSLERKQDRGAVVALDYLTKPMGTVELAEAMRRQGLEGEQEKTILIVDDDVGMLEMHARIVEQQMDPCHVIKARNGVEGLEAIQQKLPDLVLLDLMMPEMDGFEVLHVMREQETTRSIPVVVLTSKVLSEEDMQRLNQGVAVILEKGLFSVEETLTQIEDALERSQISSDPAQQYVRKAMAYLHEHYTESPSRADVADYVGVSMSYLNRCFRQEIGLTPIAYLNRYRINQAKNLLLTSEQTITEIAMALGFSSSSYFSQVFRRETGMSPSEYQEYMSETGPL